MTDFIPIELTNKEKELFSSIQSDLDNAFDESEIVRLEVVKQDAVNDVLDRLDIQQSFLAPYEGSTKQFVFDPIKGGYGVTEPAQSSSAIRDALGIALPVLSVLPTPLAPVAQFAQASQNIVSGDAGAEDLLALLGSAGINPISGITDRVNTELGLEGSFQVTDDVTANLIQGDAEGAAQAYLNTGMLPEGSLDLPNIELPEVVQPISDVLAAAEDVVSEAIPSIEIGNFDIDPDLSGLSAFDDAVIQPAVQAAAAVEDVVSEAIPETNIETPEIPSVDVSRIAGLFDGILGLSVPRVSFSDQPNRTTESLFGDLFEFETEITRV